MRLNYRLPMHLTITAIAVALTLSAPVTATIINVPADQPTIQAGINASSNGDTVLVAPGTYYENINFRGHRIVVTSYFMSDRDPQYIFGTIINGSQPTNPDTASCVLFRTVEDSTAVLQGFTLTGGKGTTWTDEHGAGEYREGGGILCAGTSPTIRFNYINDNEAVTLGSGLTSAGGGAIRTGDGNPHILNNVITRNRGRYGAGIVLNYTGAVIRNNVIAYNTGGQDYGGSGIWKYGSGPTALIENNTIVNNSSLRNGGGVYNWSATMTLTNNIIRGNTGNPGPQVANTGSMTASYCNIEGGLSIGTNITDVDPLLFGEFFYLPDGSPAIDAGNPGVLFEEQPDPDNPSTARWPSRGALTCDLGAYGGPGAYPFQLVAFGADTTVGWAPLDVQFISACRFPVTSYDWSFGDGGTDNGASPLHSYTIGGTFDVFLTVDTGGGTLSASRPAYVVALADSLVAPDTVGRKNTTMILPVRARNATGLTQIVVPFQIYGNLGLTFDSFSTVGCRTDYFEYQHRINSDSNNRRYTVKLISSAAGTSPDLPPGEGDVLKLCFTVAWNAPSDKQDTVIFTGYNSYVPLFTGPVVSYSPRTRAGLMAVACCENRGNVDGSTGPGPAVDIADITAAVRYLFTSGGARPPCDDESNVDGIPVNGSMNIADLTYLVAYIFKEGPPPPPCPEAP